LSRWKPTPAQEQELYETFIKTGKLNGVESSRAVLLIQNKFKVRTSHAYNMLRHMKTKGWIATLPPRIQIVVTAHYREATA
jgi:hypothetical protein